MMRVLVCGGRDFSDAKAVYQQLDRIHREHGIDLVIEGGASGADRFAWYWANRKKIAHSRFPADWHAHGKSAGPIRNRRMLEEGAPDLVVAFPGGNGTANMVDQARRAGVRVIEPSSRPPSTETE